MIVNIFFNLRPVDSKPSTGFNHILNLLIKILNAIPLNPSENKRHSRGNTHGWCRIFSENIFIVDFLEYLFLTFQN